MKVRTLLLATLAALLVPLVVGGAAIVAGTSAFPGVQGARVRGPHGIVGVYAQASYAWVVPVGDGVVVVDTGMERAGDALRAEIAGRPVLAVLLTHAHVDHVQGLDILPDAPVYVAAADEPMLRGEAAPKAWLASWLSRSAAPPRLPERVEVAAEGELAIGDARFRVVPVPGHTGGSVAYLWRDVLFAGDALVGGPPLALLPASFTDDEAQARASLSALLPLEFQWLADGHSGLHKGARGALFAFLDVPVQPPTVSVTDVSPAVTPARKAVKVRFEGMFVQAPFADASGRRSARLRLDDGTEWWLSEQPDPARSALWNRRVRGEGLTWTAGPGDLAPGVWLEPSSIEVAEMRSDAQTLPELAPRDGWRAGQWVVWGGVVERMTPVAEGAAWATFGVGGVQVHAPVDRAPPVGASGQVAAQVLRAGAAPVLGAARWCDAPCSVPVAEVAAGAGERIGLSLDEPPAL